MAVLWQTDSTESNVIRWGTDTSYAMGQATSQEYGDHQHKHVISGLQPDTVYYYQVDGYGSGSFQTAPESSATAVKILAYGDTRSYPANQEQVVGQMRDTYTTDPEYQTLCLLSGDWVNSGDSESDWTNQFFPTNYTELQAFKREVPIVGAKGNHEQTGALFDKYFPYPYVNDFYWSFDYGPVHVVVLDEYVSYSPGSAQYNWLESDLAATNKEWKIILLHEPGWSAGGHSNDSGVQNYIQPLCTQYGVDMVIAGHNHYYSRADVDGVQHVTTGGGGASLYDPSSSAANIVETDKSFHFCELDFLADNLDVTVRRADGSVIETFSMNHSGGSGNTAPVADAGADQDLIDSDDDGVETVLLDGLSSYDTDGTIVSYVWSEDSTTIASGANPEVDLAVGSHTITLTVTDDLGAADTDQVVVVVEPAGGSVTVSSRVSNGTDDAEQYQSGGTMYLNSSDLELVYDSSTTGNQTVGIRFNGISVPQGATILDAYVQFTVDETNSGITNLTIKGQAADNPAGFSSSAYDISSRTTTSNSVSWSPAAWNTVGAAGADQRTPNLAGIVQEIVNRSGWSQNNSMVLIVTGSGERTAESYDGSPSQAPELVISYTTGAPANQPPVANAGADQVVTDSDENGTEAVTLNGSGSSDADGQIVSYAWSEGGNQIASSATPTVNFSIGTHTVTLTVEDDAGATDSDTVDITVEQPAPTNQPPVADAGADQVVTDSDENGTEAVTLNGSGSSDADGQIVSYTWSEGGNQIASGATPTVAFSVGSHTVTLTVEDDDGANASDVVEITVEAGVPTSSTMHVGDLDGSVRFIGKSGKWVVSVAVTVHDQNHAPVIGATVSGTWSGAVSGSVSGTTDGNGTVTFVTESLKSGSSVTLDVTDVTLAPNAYEATANHDPEGDSDGTSITVLKP